MLVPMGDADFLKDIDDTMARLPKGQRGVVRVEPSLKRQMRRVTRSLDAAWFVIAAILLYLFLSRL